MAKEARRAAFGFRVKSGWATAILLHGLPPSVADRRVVELSDPAVPASRQPYHAVLEASPAEADGLEQRLCRVVQDCARRAMEELQQSADRSGCTVHDVGLVVGSKIDPAHIKNEHIRAHALEGRLFRTALEESAQALGWRSLVLIEKSAYADAAKIFGKSAEDLKRTLVTLGQAVPGPWRADEKLAALSAWMALAQSAK